MESLQSILEAFFFGNTVVRLVKFGVYSLELEIIYWVTDFSDFRILVHRVNMGILRNHENAGIKRALPTETHYVMSQNH